MFTQNIINGGAIGFKHERTSREPLLYFTENHVNATSVGVYIDGAKYVRLDRNIMYCDASPATYYDFYILNGDDITIEGNTYRYVGNPGPTTAWHVYLDTTSSVDVSALLRGIYTRDFGLNVGSGISINGYLKEVTQCNGLDIFMPNRLPAEGEYDDESNYPMSLLSLLDTASPQHTVRTPSFYATEKNNAAVDPSFTLYRGRGAGTATANDTIAEINFSGEDDGGSKVDYAILSADIADPTASSEDGTLFIYTKEGGANTKQFAAGGVNGGTASGGKTPQATGTHNAAGYYVNDTQVVGAQQNSTGEISGHAPVGGTNVDSSDTFTGSTGTRAYTINDIVKALKNHGLLASS